ncbi:MAG: CHAT domain-containing protein [Planctomycetota bacterium]|nr:CHAT domain-containing protein [Planctomycetota bacterium]
MLAPCLLVLAVALFSSLPPQETAERVLSISPAVEPVPDHGGSNAVEVTWPDACRWHLWIEASFDTLLRMESEGGEILAEDDDAGGRPTPYLSFAVEAGRKYRIRAIASHPTDEGRAVLHEVTLRETPAEAARAAEVRDSMAAVLAPRAPAEVAAGQASVRAAIEALAACGRGESALGAQLAIAAAALRIGDLHAESDVRRRVLEIQSAILPPDHFDLQRARLELARTLALRRELEEARALAEPSLAVLERTLDPDAVELQRARGEVAIVRRMSGDLPGARELDEPALQALARTLPPENELVLGARSNAAVTRAMLGDLRGARELFLDLVATYQRMGPEDGSGLQVARMNLARAEAGLGDLAAARELEETVLAVRERTLAPEHPELAKTRANLARTLRDLGDYAGARALLEKVLEVQRASLPPGHPAIADTRESLALILRRLGDLPAARAIGEEVLAEELTRHGPDDVDLQVIRLNLAATCRQMGEPQRALELIEPALESLERTVAPQHEKRLGALGMLGNTLRDLGRVEEAREVQAELLQLERSLFPDDHVDVLRAQHNLAMTLQTLGDLEGALVLAQAAVDGAARTLTADHPDALLYSGGLAGLLFETGDLAGARAIQERNLETLSTKLPEDHPEVQGARQDLAGTLEALGDRTTARALYERSLAGKIRDRPAGHPEVLAARLNLAGVLFRDGDLGGARRLLDEALGAPVEFQADAGSERQMAQLLLSQVLRASGEDDAARSLEQEVLAARSREFEPQHPALLRALFAAARGLVIDELVRRERPDVSQAPPAESSEEFRSLSRRYVEGCLSAARAVLTSSTARAAAERSAGFVDELGAAYALASGGGAFPPDPELVQLAFDFTEVARGAATIVAARAREAGTDARSSELRREAGRASRELARLAGQNAPESELDRLRAERERAESALLARAASRSEAAVGRVGFELPNLGRIADALGPEGALIAYRVHDVVDFGRREQRAGRRLRAHVVGVSGTIAALDLGPVESLSAAIGQWRGAVAAGSAPARGLAQAAVVVPDADPDAMGAGLRAVLLDRALALCPHARRIVLLLDGPLHLLPFDALPLEAAKGGEEPERVGDRYEIEIATNLAEWSAVRVARTGAGRLVAIGDVDYALRGARPGEESAVASSPRDAAGRLRGTPFAHGFPPLPATRAEIDGLAARFAELDPHATPILLTGGEATVDRALELAETARWLHVATHGWFAQEAYAERESDLPLDAQSGLGRRLDRSGAVRERSPMLLCGLAFAGADRGADARGTQRGLVTADELSTIDLSACDLAVLSACETSLGVHQAGQGAASLQEALHRAGARSVITSLWEVPDAATRDLMLEFYRRLWIEGLPKGQALWAAKRRLRDARGSDGERSASPRDWAGWVLTGDPR